MSSMMREQENFHYQWMKRVIERLEERKQRGDNTVEMQTGELQQLYMQLLTANLRCDYFTDRLAEFAGLYQRPSLALFGGEEKKA